MSNRCIGGLEARILISAMESNDVREDRFEPDTYYIEEAMG